MHVQALGDQDIVNIYIWPWDFVFNCYSQIKFLNNVRKHITQSLHLYRILLFIVFQLSQFMVSQRTVCEIILAITWMEI